MNKTVDQATTFQIDSNGKAIIDNFAGYVLTHTICPSCGKPMKLHKSKSGSFFLGCTGYPDCKTTSKIEVDFVDDYLYRNGNTGQHCPRCHLSLEVKKGWYGVYVQCYGIEHHIFKLDEI